MDVRQRVGTEWGNVTGRDCRGYRARFLNCQHNVNLALQHQLMMFNQIEITMFETMVISGVMDNCNIPEGSATSSADGKQLVSGSTFVDRAPPPGDI